MPPDRWGVRGSQYRIVKRRIAKPAKGRGANSSSCRIAISGLSQTNSANYIIVLFKLLNNPHVNRTKYQYQGGIMRFKVGSFMCELSIKDGDLKAEWMPWQPMYLNKAHRAEYAAYRALFLEREQQQRTRRLAQLDQAPPKKNARLRLVESPPVQASRPAAD
jgi:hypothetical protein